MHLHLPSPLVSVTFLQLCIIIVTNWSAGSDKENLPLKLFLSTVRGLLSRWHQIPTLRKGIVPVWYSGTQCLVISRGPFQPQEFCDSVIFIVGKKFFMLFCFIVHCSPTCSIVLFFNHLPPPHPVLPLFSLLSLFLVVFYSLSAMFSFCCSMCSTMVMLWHILCIHAVY